MLQSPLVLRVSKRQEALAAKRLKAVAKAEAAAETMRMPGKPLVPKKYFSPDTSALKVEVLSGKDNVFDFVLEGELTP